MATITRKTIRQGDDFKILITFKDRDGAAVEATQQQFKFIYRDIYGGSYEIGYDGTTRTHCYVENGHLVGVFEDYKLACCVLKREAWYWVADPAFSDGKWDHGNTVLSDIELTRDGGTREVAEEAEVSCTICVNETLAISKGDPFEYEDFTPEQLAALKGDPFRYNDFTPEQLEALRGKTGKSAYQLAVAGGYAGTEAQFKTEQANIANNSARLATVEQSKANLVDGYVPSYEIDPLQGKQTGVEIDKANRLSSKVPVSFSSIIGSNNFSIEFYYDSNKLTMPSGAIYGLCYISDIVSIYRQSTGDISFQLINRRTDGTRYSISLTNKAPYNGRLHVVLTVNRTTNEFTAYINNIKFDQKIFTEKISHNINTVITIGETKIGAAKTDIIQFRVFNKELLKDDVTSLWNGGHPEEYRLIDKSSLFAEYIPEYLSLSEWKDSSGNGNDLMSVGDVALSYGCKYAGSPMTPLFVACGAVFNETTGLYERNGLTDITESQMYEIYYRSIALLGGNWAGSFYGSSARTAIVNKHLNSTVNAEECFRDSFVETLQFSFMVGVSNDLSPSFTNCYLMFHNCRFLRKINGWINCASLTNTTFMFTGCIALEEVYIKGLKLSISFADSPHFLRDCIVYLITNAANTTPITLTLHAEAKARLTEADIALASSKNMTIA